MKDYYGDIDSRIWLIGDSPPTVWKDFLRFPLDTHHPAVHNIWTPVLSKINDYLFDYGLRLKDNSLYIRNAVNDSDHWHLNHNERDSISRLGLELHEFKPTVVITFGDKSYIMTRQTLSGDEGYPVIGTHSHSLGEIFRVAIDNFDISKINVLPLLHTSVSRGHFLKGQADFCGIDRDEYRLNEQHDYFTYTGSRIGTVLCQEYFFKTHKTLSLLKQPLAVPK